MADKVIYEMRVERVNNRYQYRIRHPQEGLTVSFPAGGKCRPVFFPVMRKKVMRLRNRRMREKSRQHMRRTLDFYEELYDQLYGEEGAGNASQELEK